jgi:hypothetical protein
MDGLTTTDHVVKGIGGAIVGAAILGVAAPVVLPMIGLGALAAVAGAPIVGATIGGLVGWAAGKPSDEQMTRLIGRYRG